MASDLADAFTAAATQTRRNIDALAAAIGGGQAPTVGSDSPVACVSMMIEP